MWAKDTIWWHVYPLGFTGAPVRPSNADERVLAHRLSYLTRSLDHLVELGANGLLLGPIFSAGSHGYDTTDFYSIDPRLGDDDDFSELITECRARGIRVLLDGVFNHVGISHPLFVEAQQQGIGKELFVFQPDGSYASFEGHTRLPELNHDEPAVAKLVQDVMTHWLGRGIDGWRLDAAYSVDPRFWAQVLPAVRAEYPEAWFLGEVIHADFASFQQHSTIDSLTQYPLWKAIWSSLKDKNFFELDWALRQHNDLLQHFSPNTFVSNHDVSRIFSQVGDATVLAHAILATVGGIPSIYYGDELGFEGLKTEGFGGDDVIRPFFKTNEPSAHPWVMNELRALVAIRRRNPWLVDARTDKIELTNERYIYETVDGQNKLRVDMDVSGKPSVRISSGPETIYSFFSQQQTA